MAAELARDEIGRARSRAPSDHDRCVHDCKRAVTCIAAQIRDRSGCSKIMLRVPSQLDRRVAAVGAIVCEGQPDRPTERKMLMRRSRTIEGAMKSQAAWCVGETRTRRAIVSGRSVARVGPKAYSLPLSFIEVPL